MKKSEILTQAIELAKKTSLSKIWIESMEDIKPEYQGPPVALFLSFEDEYNPSFTIFHYCTQESGLRQVIEQQNPVIFIGWVGLEVLYTLSILELLEEKIENLKYSDI